jgi:alpha-tubulin suppressor-like RCC1 family protein
MSRRTSLRTLAGSDRRTKHPRAAARSALLLGALSLSLVALPAAASAETSSPGELYAFGANEFGELGSTLNNGSEAANPTPLRVGLPGAEDPVVQLAVGDGATLVVTADGRLYSFGENLYGELGRALGSGSEAANPVPAPVSLPGGHVVQAAAGGAHSLVLTAPGQLYAFGQNFYGQLGSTTNNGKENANPTPAALALPGANGPVIQIAAGDTHSLALTAAGQLYAFGSNEFGQLGNPANSGTELANPTPLAVALPGASGPVVQIAAGASHSLALTSTGQLYAFGSNRFGQLGDAIASGTLSPTPTPTQVSLPGASGPVIQIAAGGFHSLALTSTGQLYAFGSNAYGQLGNEHGEATPNPTPTLVSLPAGAAPIVQLAAGADDSLIVTASGQLFTFGANTFGQLGNAVNSASSLPNPRPTLAGLPPATTIDLVARGSSAEHSLALTADLAVLNGVLPAGQVGVPYSASAAAAGGGGTYSWSASGLPAGLSIDPLSGQISGTPIGAGASNVVLHVSDLFGIGATSPAIPLTIVPALATRAFISSTLTQAQLRASLSMQLGAKGRQLRIAALRKRRSYVYAFTALTAGTLKIDWYYLPPGARLARTKPVLFASGSSNFPTAGTRKLTLRLTTAARKLLRHRRRSIALAVQGSFTPKGKPAIIASRNFRLTR